MGRLFWKFFFFIWLAQLTTLLGASAVFWWKDLQREARWEALHSSPSAPNPEAEASKAPPETGPRGDGGRPPRGPHRHHRHGPPLPIEPLVGGLLGSLIFAALLARYFSRPIRTLRSAFDDAAAGKLHVRVGSAMAGSKDELNELGQDFDRMAAQLEALVEGQRRLLHDVSHEMRSPLARLQAAIGLARQQPAKLDSSLERIEKESVRMDRLVEELLTLSRLEAGTAGRRVEPVEVAELLSGIVGDARFEAGTRDVRVELAGDCEGVIDGDGELLHRAIENVVRNAVRYSPAGSAVTVATRIDEAADQLWITVKDSGPGVPADELESIFIPFYRGSRAKEGDGHGLGLAIAKRVVESKGGRIGGANRAEGGFCMEIILPVRLPG